jgi:hypothetical protein
MRDYITEVIDTPVFRTALLAEAEAGSKHCYVDDNGEAKLIADKNPIKATGVKSVALSRLNQEQVDWFLSLPMTAVIGKAKDTVYTDEDGVEQVAEGKFIKSFDDIEWIINGEQRYYAAYNRSAVSYQDENCDIITVTQPLLHGIIAS